MCCCVTGGTGKPIGLMHSFIGNCQHLSAARSSFVRLKEIALQRDVSLCLWHTHHHALLQEGRNCATDATVTCGAFIMGIKTKRGCKTGNFCSICVCLSLGFMSISYWTFCWFNFAEDSAVHMGCTQNIICCCKYHHKFPCSTFIGYC